jgi:serine/threonine-protein kinase HipA
VTGRDDLEVHIELDGGTVLAGHAQFQRIAGSDTIDDEADGLRALAASCRLSSAGARDQLQLVIAALETWPDVALRNGVAAPELARFEDSFAAGVDSLRRAAR